MMCRSFYCGALDAVEMRSHAEHLNNIEKYVGFFKILIKKFVFVMFLLISFLFQLGKLSKGADIESTLFKSISRVSLSLIFK